MSIQSIKNTKLRRTVLVVFGPPIVVVGFVYFGCQFIAEFVESVVEQFGAAWNG